MKRLAFIILLLALAAIAAIYFMREPGTADINWLGWQLHTSALGLLAMALAAFILIGLAWRIFAALFNIPKFWRHRSMRQKRSAADEQLLQAWAELERGRFDVAAKLALSQHQHASLAPMHYVVATDALLAKHDAPAALNLLDEVRKNFPRFADYLALHLAKQLHAQHNLPAAIELLHHSQTRHPKDEAITCTLAEVLYSAADWEKLATLLPSLRRLKWPGMTEQDLRRLELGVYRGLIDLRARQHKPEALNALWGEVPKALRDEPALLITLAQAWLVLGQPVEAERVLEKALNQHSSNALLRVWLALPPADPVQARNRLARWINQTNNTIDEATRSYAEADLAWRSGDIEAAQHILAPQLAKLPDTATLILAANIAQHQRDSAQALALTTQAFERLTLEAPAR